MQHELAYRQSQSFGDPRGGIERRIRQDDQQLLAAVATRQVRPANASADQIGELAQDVVAGSVTEGVVQALEVMTSAITSDSGVPRRAARRSSYSIVSSMKRRLYKPVSGSRMA